MTVAVYDARGARVAFLVDAGKPAGANSVRWNGRDGRGIPVASGVYFVRLRTPLGERVTRAVLMK